jgi:uncharacterized delta-60 repeat protein
MGKILVLCVIVAAVIGFLVIRDAGPFAGESGPTYDLTIAISEGGHVELPGEVSEVGAPQTFTYEADTLVELKAVPVSGYSFVNWTGGVDTVANVTAAETTVTMSGDCSIVANFALTIDPTVSYTLTVAVGDGGSVSEPEDLVGTYYGNTVVNLLAVPASGYAFFSWTGDVDTVANTTAADTTITMQGNCTIAANFRPLYTLTVSSSNGGSVTTPGEGEFICVSGTAVSLATTPDTDYFFYGWTGDVDTIADPYSGETNITVGDDYSITAEFVRWEAVYYDGAGHDADQVSDTVMDGQGNVYVTGSSLGNGTNYDYATIKYDSEMNEAWVARYDGVASGIDKAHAIAMDSAGNIYVTGESQGSSLRDFVTIKYDSEGTEQWVARYNGTANGRDVARDIALYEDGVGGIYIYVTGNCWVTGQMQDYLTIRYDNDGNQEWTASYNGPGDSDDYPKAIALDTTGNAYVTGRSYASGTDDDYATIKYSSAGAEQWVARFDGTGHLYDEPADIQVDSDGNVYVTGKTTNGGNEYDYATLKYNSSGAQQWLAIYDGVATDHDEARAMVLDGGSVYVTGCSEGDNTDYDYATVKYSASDGNEEWAVRYDGDANLGDEASAIAVDEAGNIYVAGNSYVVSNNSDYVVVKYAADGSESWGEPVRYPVEGEDDYATTIAVGDGYVYVSGYSARTTTGDDYATIRITQ